MLIDKMAMHLNAFDNKLINGIFARLYLSNATIYLYCSAYLHYILYIRYWTCCIFTKRRASLLSRLLSDCRLPFIVVVGSCWWCLYCTCAAVHCTYSLLDAHTSTFKDDVI